MLYDTNNTESNSFIANYYYNVEPDTSEYRFQVSWNADGINHTKEYALLIESAILHLYSTGVGVISLHLNNRRENQSLPDDILRINQYGRRIYPPFFCMDNEQVGKVSQYDTGGFDSGLHITQQKELAQWITIDNDAYREDFSGYTDSRYFSKNTFQLPMFFRTMFREIPITTNLEDRYSLRDGIFISPLLDDRMYVVCWYGNDEAVKSLKPATDKKNEDGCPYLTDDWWYKYIFVDSGLLTCQNDTMKKDLLEDHTYARWVKYGTLFGVSRYSFVCLTGSLDTLKKVNAAFLVTHVQTMYYKLAELCLVQRACILRFGEEVAEISSMNEKFKRHLSGNVRNLYKQYIRFVNKIYFREVTAQEQGIELYDMLQEKMRIAENVKSLDEEIEELYNYVNLKEQSEQTVQVSLLTWIAILFLPPSLIAAYFGMNFYEKHSFSGFLTKPFWMMIGISVLFAIILVIVSMLLIKKCIRKIR